MKSETFTMTMKPLSDTEFDLQVISRGAYLDSGTIPGEVYEVEAISIRLNHVALNEWFETQEWNSRDCYETLLEWQKYCSEIRTKRYSWEKKVVAALKLDADALGCFLDCGASRSIAITQSLSEVFSVVCIHKLYDQMTAGA